MGRPKGTKNVMRTPEEKEKILQEYLINYKSLKDISDEYNIDLRLLKTWKKKYLEKGIDGLKSLYGKSSTGRRIKPNTYKEELELKIMKLEIENARLKKRLSSERSWGRKGIRYYIRCEYKIMDELKDKYPIMLLCNTMSVSKSGYYKWKYRQQNPSEKELSR